MPSRHKNFEDRRHIKLSNYENKIFKIYIFIDPRFNYAQILHDVINVNIQGDSLCPTTTSDCSALPCGQNCLYQLATSEGLTVTGTHQTPVARL